MARTTISQVVERIRRELSSTLRYETDLLAVNLNATSTTVTFTYDLPPSVRNGAVISIGTEAMRVLAYSAASKEVTVIRGWFDSTAEAHLVGDEIWINPRFLGQDIFEAMHDELASWPAGLYRVSTAQVAITAEAQTVELPAAWIDMYGLIDARRKWNPGGYATPDTTETTWPRVQGRLQRSNPTVWTEGPSTGVQFRVTDAHGQGSLIFEAARPFDLSGYALTQDLVTDVGMQLSQLDMLTMGVKIRLMPNQEIGRSERRGQDDSRRAEETPPDSALTTTRALFPIYQRRRSEEITRLNALHPIRWV